MENKKLVIFDFDGVLVNTVGVTFDFIKKLIFEFADKYILAVVSSSTSSPISEFLKKEEVRDCFSEICGSDVHQSKVVKINFLLEKYLVDKKDVIFITDTLGDIRDGNECEINSIGVTWGTHSRQTLLKGKPYEIVDDVLNLEIAVNNFFNSSRAKN